MAQQSLAGGERVRVVTYLAFFFVPMTLVASLFGMNVQQFSGGKEPHIRVYFSTAAGTTILTLFFAVALTKGWIDIMIPRLRSLMREAFLYFIIVLSIPTETVLWILLYFYNFLRIG